MTSRIILTLIIFNLAFHWSSGQENTIRWGLLGERNTMVVDETEILVIEWLEYVFYNDLSKFKTYITTNNCYHNNLTAEEREILKHFKIDPNTKPDSTILSLSPFGFLFNDSPDKVLVNFRDGLKGPICIPVDTAALNNVIGVLHVKTQKAALYRILTLPITGVTYEQAIAFCNWRNNYEKLTYQFRLTSGKQYADIYEYYSFSLPTKSEFVMYNTNLDSIQATGKNAYSRFNYKDCLRRSETTYPYSQFGIEPVVAYYKAFSNSRIRHKKFVYSGLKNVQGNVAEMSIIKGEALGGSYFHFAIQSYGTVTIHYDGPALWLGFRCIGRRELM